MSQAVDLSGLLPDFPSLWLWLQSTVGPTSTLEFTSEQLSAIFVVVLGLFFLFFLWRAYSSSRKSARRLNAITKLLKNEKPETLFENRLGLLDRARKIKGGVGHLWSEFDESLVIVKSKNQSNTLFNTLDSSHFFNTSTLAPEITENRTLAAVPGYLTGIGVLGTFIGLQLGLSELHIGNDVAVEEMKAGLAQVISGAKIAFLTSVWGVGLSLIFNIFEKFLERSARKKIHKLQNKIDDLFPRLTAESQLQKIADNSAEAKDDLKLLAEKIGDRMQEAIEDLGDRISGPIGDLATNTGEASQNVLESLIKRFLDEFGAAGGQQAKAMQEANERFSVALNSLDASMSLLLKRLEESQDSGAKREQELIKNMSLQIDVLVKNSHEQHKLLTDTVDKQLSQLLAMFDKQEASTDEREDTRNSNVNALLKRLETGLDSQLKASHQLIEQGGVLQDRVEGSIVANLEASTKMKDSASELNAASQHMKGTGRSIEQAGQQLSGSITQAVSSTTNLAEGNRAMVSLLQSQQQLLNEQQQRFNDSIRQMSALFDTANGSFDQIDGKQKQFLSDLQLNINQLSEQLVKHVNALSSSMTTMLASYSEQVNAQTSQRVESWVENTTNYTSAMQEAVDGLSGVVDDIQDKVNR